MYLENHAIKHLNMHDLSLLDRPREKIKQYGIKSTSLAELIAILIRSGNKNENAIELSKKILKSCNNNLHELSLKPISFFKKFKGVGEVKALSIIAALEIAKRFANIKQEEINIKVTKSQDLYNIIAPKLIDIDTEECWVIFVNRFGNYISSKQISRGNETSTTVDQKLVFKLAIENNASNIAIVHNHPSGSPIPSVQDKIFTNNLIRSGKILGIKVIDHIIIARKKYYSFSDNKLI